MTNKLHVPLILNYGWNYCIEDSVVEGQTKRGFPWERFKSATYMPAACIYTS